MKKQLIDDIEISLMGGGLFGFATYLIMLRTNPQLWWLCFVTGGGLFAILVAYLLGYHYLVTERYAKTIDALGVTVSFKTQGNFLTEYGKRTGFIYFCDDRLVLISLDKRPRLTIQILAEDVVSYSIPRAVQLNLQMKDGSQKTIHSADVGVLGSMIKKKKWCKK